MSRFLDNAVSLLDSAESAFRAGFAPSDMAILISPEGGIRMVADSDWPLESLQSYHGARTAYRVSQQNKRVRVEGTEGTRSCRFESAAPNLASQLLINPVPPMYSIAPVCAQLTRTRPAS
ncbi:MAG: hypothetical protein ACR2NN_07420 [Bryobacteraceae bacterium]